MEMKVLTKNGVSALSFKTDFNEVLDNVMPLQIKESFLKSF